VSTSSDRSTRRGLPQRLASMAAPAPAVPQFITSFTSTWSMRPPSKAKIGRYSMSSSMTSDGAVLVELPASLVPYW
jgi:hypothetical protein